MAAPEYRAGKGNPSLIRNQPIAYKMKSIVKSALLPLLGTAMLAAPALGVTTTNGDLLLAFYQVDSSGVVQPNTYVFNLGQGSVWRENTQVGVSVSTVNGNIASSNINADLVAAFGSNWASSGTVRWGLVGGLDQTTAGLVGGERQQTSYISQAAGSAQPAVNGADRNTLRNQIEFFRNGSNGTGTNVGNANGAMILGASSLATVEDFFSPSAADPSSTFGIPLSMFQAIGGEGALDIWRLVGGSSTADLNASGTDLTAGLSDGNAVLGRGQYIGTIVIDQNGNLSVVPEVSSTLTLGLFAVLGLTRRKRSKLS